MAETFEFKPLDHRHPGETVIDYLETLGWSQRELARRSGLSTKSISEICNGKANITAATAIALEMVWSRPASFWLNLQRHYDEGLARSELREATDSWKAWASQFPVAELRKLGWIDDGAARPTHESLLQFFGVSSPKSWYDVWETTSIVYRQTRKIRINQKAVSAWVRAVEIEAGKTRTEPFDETKLRGSLPELRRLTMLRPENFMPKLKALGATAGVAVVFVPGFKNTGISGCTRWVSRDKAAVGLTLRYKSDDEVWFTLFHELGHVLLHRRKFGLIVDNADKDLRDGVVDPEMRKIEEEANQFAADSLIPPARLAAFVSKRDLSQQAIVSFAKELEIAPGILIGRLQREEILERYQGNKLKQMFHWSSE